MDEKPRVRSLTPEDLYLEAVDLPEVRSIVATVASGPKSASDVASARGFSVRRTLYRLNAAYMLGWVTREEPQLALPIHQPNATPPPSASARFSVSETGRSLLATAEESPEERLELNKALMGSESLRRYGGAFMTEDVDLVELAKRIQSGSDVAENVARRRARILLAWKSLALGTKPKTALATDLATAKTAPTPAIPSPGFEFSVQLNAYVASQISLARLELLIGPGLSRRALTRKGAPPPNKMELARAVWALCFHDSEVDAGADVDELLQVAAQRNPKGLASLMKDAFSLDPNSVSDTVAALFGMPFQKIYTLAVDDVELAVDALRSLPRKIATVTADTPQISAADKLPVIHLHGTAQDGSARFSVFPDRSTSHGLAKLAERFEAEFLAYPFLALATDEDVDDVWKALERRGRKGARGTRELRPKSVLVCPKLSPVRIALARENNIEYVRSDPFAFIDKYLRPLKLEIATGHEVLRSIAATSIDDPANVDEVSEALLREKPRRTEYLMGQEPTWDDIRSGRAIVRESDQAVVRAATEALAKRKVAAQRTPAAVLVLVGTAGTGKSTAMMRLAIELSAKGYKAGWIGSSTEFSSKSIREFRRVPSRFSVLLIDDVDRYGGRAAENLVSLADSPGIELVVATMHAARAHLLEDPNLAPSHPATVTMPPLADTDIDRLINALDTDHRLGVLKGRPRAYQESVFKEQAGRSLLVAMIQATSGRRFEEKVLDEWKELQPRARYYYTLITIASSLGYALNRDDLLRAGEATRTPDDLASIEVLASGNIIARPTRDTFKSRHRLIAETLMKDLVREEHEHSAELERCYRDLAFSVTHLLGRGSRETTRGRFAKRLLSYKELHRVISLDGARSIYEVVEDNMHWDYHYWLQRGSLEVAEGDVRHAEQYLTYAMNMNPGDNLVITEFAYMRMKLAVSEPRSADAAAILSGGVEMLRGQIANRGQHDYYPYHVLGSQALAWVTRCGWDRDDKVSFLRSVYSDLAEGAKRHPKHLETLARDVKQRMLAIGSGLQV